MYLCNFGTRDETVYQAISIAVLFIVEWVWIFVPADRPLCAQYSKH